MGDGITDIFYTEIMSAMTPENIGPSEWRDSYLTRSYPAVEIH